MILRRGPILGALGTLCLHASPGEAQVDTGHAAAWFAEAAAICQRDAGRLWGVSLCGPMVIGDRATGTRATNRPAPDGPVPPLVGLVNAPVQWGGTRWAAYVWSMLPATDSVARRRVLLHELFHVVQPQLGMYLLQPDNDHLDGEAGRYWLRLEWRALARALGSTGEAEHVAIADALAFRARRRVLFVDMVEREHALEVREGLAQYTGTVLATGDAAAARADARRQVEAAEGEASYVRSFAYSNGAAYGVLLDAHDPGWPRRFSPADDLGTLLQRTTGVTPAADPVAAALRYGGLELAAAERARAAEHRERVARLTARFVEGPVLIVPRHTGAMVITTGATPIPGAGTVIMEYRLTAPWGSIVATKGLLESSDNRTLRVPGPFTTSGNRLAGDGWEVTLAEGWGVVTGERVGDHVVARNSPE